MVLGVVSACGGQLRVREPAPGEDYLGELRIEGNHAIETGAIEPALALHETLRDGAAIDPYLLTADAERIRAAYLKRGFFEAKVATRVERRGAHVQIVVFTVTEGQRAVTRVEIAGLPPELPLPRARALVVLGDGAPFDYDAYDAAKQPLAALVENAGYAHARVDSKVVADPATATATARYEVTPGVRCTFGTIRIGGELQESLAAAVRARLRFAPGDRYSVSALEASQGEIYELGRFSTVLIRPEHVDGAAAPGAAVPGTAPNDAVAPSAAPNDAVIDVTVELALATRYELHAGGGLGIEPLFYEARVRGGGSLVPASLPLATLAADARVALTKPNIFDNSQVEPRVRGLVSLQYLDLLWPRLRGEVEAGADYQTVERYKAFDNNDRVKAYTWFSQHVRLGLGSPLGPRWLQLRVGWVFEHLTLSDFNSAIDPESANDTARALGLKSAQLRGAYQVSLVADLRDNQIEPHRGIYLALGVTKGTRLAGGDLTYLQLTPEVRGYVSFGGVVIAARARAGAIFGDVPVTERYFSGGATGQRGLSEARLAPAVRDCVDGADSTLLIGGAGLLETGVELRRQLGTIRTYPIGANVFLDGADVQCTPRDLDPRSLNWAIGAGVWGKLVGDLKIRVDLGYRLNGTKLYSLSSESHAFHLGVGEVF